MADRRGIAGIGGISLTLAVLAPLAACSSGGGEAVGPHRIDAAAFVHLSAEGGGKVDPSKPLTVTSVPGSRLTDVTVTGPDGRVVAGQLAEDQHSWQTTGRLKADTDYSVRIAADDGKGGRGDTTADFSTLAAQRLLTAKLGPDSSGSGIYGVGQPLTVQLSEAVQDPQARQEVERVLTVSSQPAVTGAWYWVGDKELHFRPQEYWPAGTTVSLAFDGTGVRIEDGLYGGDRSTLGLRIGARVETVVDAAAHVLTLSRDGELVRSIPVTTGKPGFDTRNGVKVVLGQERSVRMNGETIGIKAGRLGVLRPQRGVGHPRHLERRVRPRGALVGPLAGPGERQPRLYRHEHRERQVVLPEHQGGGPGDGGEQPRRHHGAVRQRLRGLEHLLDGLGQAQRPRRARQHHRAGLPGPRLGDDPPGGLRAPGAPSQASW